MIIFLVLFFTLFWQKISRFLIPPHPLRCPILELFAEKQIDAAGDAIIIFKDLMQKTVKSLSEKFSGYDIQLNLPPVAQFVVDTTEKRGDLFERILEVRESTHAKDFRKWCAELQEALSLGLTGIAKAQRLYGVLNKACDMWSRDLQEHVEYKRRKLKISSVLQLLGIETEFEVKDKIIFGSDLKHMLFLNDMVSFLR